MEARRSTIKLKAWKGSSREQQGRTRPSRTFAYDGFGNLTDKTPTLGSPPALHVAVNASNNRVVGYGYDANGNLTSGDLAYTYDVANRVASAKSGSNPSEQYSYGPENQRVWKLQPDGTESLYFYGAFGELLGEYPIVPASAPTYYYPGLGTTRLYFAGKLINYVASSGSNLGSVIQDRLGSVAYNGGTMTSMRYYPWGEEYTTTAQNTEKFGTYYRDKTSGLDYGKNRYYSSILGRFMTADPYWNSAGLGDPGSWNRYAYVLNDPVNFNDHSGLEGDGVATGCFIDVDGVCDPSFPIGVTIGPITRSGSGYPPPYRETAILPGFSDPAYSILVAAGNSPSYTLLSVNWDVIFEFEIATGTWPSTWPQGGLTWEAILAALRANPLTAVLAFSLVQTGGSGPGMFPRQNCPKGPDFWDPTKSPGKNWVWKGTGPIGSRQGAWYNPITDESLHPDITHPPGKPPHWGYTDPTGQRWECYPDGTYRKIGKG